MVENLRENYVGSTDKRNVWKKFLGLPKTIRYTAIGAGAAAILFFFTTGGASKLAIRYNDLRAHWQARSESTEAKIEKTGIAYMPLADNTNVLDSDSSKVINLAGLEKITALPFSQWAGKRLEETALGDTAKVMYDLMASDTSLTNTIIGFYILTDSTGVDSTGTKLDSTGAYTASLVRNNNGELELALMKYIGFNRERSITAQKADAFAQLSTTVAERDSALVREKTAKVALSSTKQELSTTKTELNQTKETVKVYVNDEQRVIDEYKALKNKYGLKKELQGDIRYNVEFRPVQLEGRETYEAVITNEKKKMSATEKTTNLSFLRSYMTLLSQIEKETNGDYTTWKEGQGIVGLKTTITPVKNGLKVIILNEDGSPRFTRSNIAYSIKDMSAKLNY